MRVLIKQDVPEVSLGIGGRYELWQGGASTLLGRGDHLRTQRVQAVTDGIALGDTRWPTGYLRVVPLDPAHPVQINGRQFRGEIQLISKGIGKLWVINRVEIEDYLPGVLGWEAGGQWPMEVLKAHAVVSRTMVAHRIWINRTKEYDVKADVSTQVYGGKNSEKWRSAKACRETRGQVLAWGGELLSATFHASCGGHTEDAKEIWEAKGDLAPLRGRPDPYCRGLKHYRWKKWFEKKELMAALGEAAAQIGELEVFEVLGHSPSGRVRAVRLAGSGGEATLSGRRLRELLGANRLRSLKFTVQVSRWGVSFDGFGWGHGVGFCQWGAYGMAKQGKTMDEILVHYFPGAARRRLQGLPGFDR